MIFLFKILGIRIIEPCSFVDLIEPTESRKTWRAKVEPQNDFMENYDFDCLVVASGKNVPIEGFARQSLDAKLAIAVTANFVNNRTAEDSQSDEIAGLAYQYHQVSNIQLLQSMSMYSRLRNKRRSWNKCSPPSNNICMYTHFFIKNLAPDFFSKNL